MLNKKILCGLVALSYAAFSPVCSLANTLGNSVSLYAGVGGTGQFAMTKDVTVVGTTGATIQGQDKGDTYVDGYKPDYKMGYMGSVHVGLVPVNPLRVEVEFSYSHIGVADSDDNKNDKNFQVKTSAGVASVYEHKGLSHMAGLLNVYYDVPGVLASVGDIAPYVGFGAGMARITFNDIVKNSVAYQGKIGATVGIPGMPARFYIGGKMMGVLDGENGFEKVMSGNTSYNLKVPYMSYGAEAGVMMHFAV